MLVTINVPPVASPSLAELLSQAVPLIPTTESVTPPQTPPSGEFKILPFIGTPVNYHNSPKPSGPGRFGILPVAAGRGGHHHGHHHHRMSFLHRVHKALMVLGPWEGRAVAFVLGMFQFYFYAFPFFFSDGIAGCGIGVLLRMIWVMTIVLFRTFRGNSSSDDADVHDVLVFEADAEDILVPPPQYTDEKVALVPEPENKA